MIINDNDKLEWEHYHYKDTWILMVVDPIPILQRQRRIANVSIVDTNSIYGIHFYPNIEPHKYLLLEAYNKMYYNDNDEFTSAKEAMDRVDTFIIKYRKLKVFL